MKNSLAFVGVTATLLLCTAVPAHADSVTTISLRAQHAPVTAAGFDAQACGPTGASQTRDRWLFALPAGRFTFTTVTARFAPRRDARTATVVASAPGPRGVITPTRATISTPRGLWLIGATATVRGKGKKPTQFTLSRTCAAKPPQRQAPDRPAAPVAAPRPDYEYPADPPAAEYPAPEYPASESPAAAPPETAMPWPSEDEGAYAPDEETASPSASAEADALVNRSDSGDGGLPEGFALVGLLAAAGLSTGGAVLVTALLRRRRKTTATDDATQDLPIQPASA